ncbi:MAG: flagellar filament capping protein FliD [Oscillospiraceae bacterium]|nr:flagellar filament capping protein FliD [Oscillospiraceae bacterium]
MSSVNSTSSSTASYSSNGLSGLVSGLDTDAMVKKMLSGTQTKIDKVKQQQQVLTWKQTMYKSIVSKINTLRNKYFDSSYGSELTSNLSSSSFFNSMVSSVSSGSSVKVVSTGSSASQGDTTFLVSQLASTTKLSSAIKMSGAQTITGTAMDVDTISSVLSSGESLSFDLSLDGVSKTITFSSDDFSEGITPDTIKTVLDTKVKTAFGTYVGVSMADEKLSFSINLTDGEGNVESGHELKITGSAATKFGITPGASSLLSTSSTLGSISGVSGKTYKFAINDVDFEFSSTDTVSAMMKKINDSTAGVKISYSTSTDSFKMEATSSGAQYGIDITQSSGNLLTLMFGSDAIAGGASATGSMLNTSAVAGTALSDDYTTTGATMSFKVNGVSYKFTLSSKSTGYTKSEVESSLNTWLTSTFGSTDGAANISYADGKLTTAAGYYVSFDKTTVDSSDSSAVAAAEKSDLAYAMGFSLSGANNGVTDSTDITDVMGISGMTFLNSSNETATKLSDIAFVKVGETSYAASYADGKLTLSNDAAIDLSETGLASYFGDSVTFGTGTFSSGAVKAGTDLKVTINGVETSRSSNTFTVDGLTVTATKVSSEETVITTDRDVDSIVDAVKSFISDYNDLVGELYGIISEDAEYRDYAPLTDDQKDEMSDTEIEEWTDKAKTGLLRNDTYVSSFLQSMRSAFYTKVESAGIAAYSIGIETTKNDYSGKLSLDETALRNAISSDPDAVSRLFTDSENGLSTLLANACDKTAKLSVASPGALVQVAGATDWTANAKTNDMYYDLQRLKDKLDDLKDKYDDEKERYWNKFTAMESVIAQYNSQSALITSNFSTGS